MPRRKTRNTELRQERASRVDSDWFKARMEARGISMRGAAAQMGVDPSALSRRIHGEAEFDLYEAVDLAHILDEPFTSFVAKCGVVLPREVGATVPLVGVAGVGGLIDTKRKLMPSKVDKPYEAPARSVAVRVEAPAAAIDHWVCFYLPSTKIEAEAVGRLDIVQTHDGKEYLTVLNRGYERGRWNLQPLVGGPPMEDVMVSSATPVLMIRT